MRLKIFALMLFQCFILINEINSQLYLGAGFGIDNSNIVQSTFIKINCIFDVSCYNFYNFAKT